MTDHQTAQRLLAMEDVLILTHRRPDGDTIGCACALCLALRQLGKTAWALPNEDAHGLFTPYFEGVLAPAEFVPQFVVSVDTAALGMLPGSGKAYADRIDLAIDHHGSNEGYAKQTRVDPDCAACAELLYRILVEMGVRITAPIALLLYMAIASDTGCFVYSNTTPDTHRIAAALMETGVDAQRENKRHFRVKSLKRMQIESRLVREMDLAQNGTLVFAYVTLDLIRELEAAEEDMEDISAYKNLRKELAAGRVYGHLSENLSDFLAQSLLPTTDLVMDRQEKKKQVKFFTNPEQCDITEDLVLTEPYLALPIIPRNKNIVTTGIEFFVLEHLYEVEDLHAEVAALRNGFMNNAQALIHGDLHTGSIFVKQDSTRVFDPEFAFYGPMGYDIGNVVANMIFAWDNGRAAGADAFCDWCLKAIADTIDLFCEKFLVCFDACVTDLMAKTPGFKEYYLDSILSDTAAYAGTELIRRTVGMANVKDVTTIADEAKRAHAEKVNILCAKDYIMNRTAFKNGADFIAAVTRADEAAK